MAVELHPMTIHDLEIRLKEYQARFGVDSSRIVEAMVAGELEESGEVLEWESLYSMYVDLTGRPTI